MFNTHVIIDSCGEIKGRYDKLHLFDADVPNGPSLKESEVVQRGSRYANPVETPIGPVAMGIVGFDILSHVHLHFSVLRSQIPRVLQVHARIVRQGSNVPIGIHRSYGTGTLARSPAGQGHRNPMFRCSGSPGLIDL